MELGKTKRGRLEPSPYNRLLLRESLLTSRVKVLDRPEHVTQSPSRRYVFVFIYPRGLTISYSKQFSLSLDFFLGVYCFYSPFECSWHCFYYLPCCISFR